VGSPLIANAVQPALDGIIAALPADTSPQFDGRSAPFWVIYAISRRWRRTPPAMPPAPRRANLTAADTAIERLIGQLEA
jgi:hypothetical protein